MLHCSKDYEAFFGELKKYDLRGSEWYGGSYFDDLGDIHIKYVDGLCKKSYLDEIAEAAKRANARIVFEKGRYSYRELSNLCGEILASPEDIRRGIVGAGMNEKDNKITLAVTSGFRDAGGLSGRDEFSVERFEWLRTDISLRPADKLSNGKCFFMAGYPAKDSGGVRGIVTAGHLPDTGKETTVFYNGEEIGCVRKLEYSDIMDAAFVELNRPHDCSDIVSVAPNPRINDIAPEFLCGAAVEMYSSDNGSARIGRVKYPVFDFMNLKNITVFTYSSSAGDSGAPVLIPFPSGEHGLLGIHLGAFSLGGTVYSYGRRADKINACFSLEFDKKIGEVIK